MRSNDKLKLLCAFAVPVLLRLDLGLERLLAQQAKTVTITTMNRSPRISALAQLAQVQNVSVRYVGHAAARLAELFGRAIPDDLLAAAVGALDGAMVEVQLNSDGRIVAALTHPHIKTQIRILSRDAEGKLFVTNDLFRTNETAPSGTGLRSFARQVAVARALGFIGSKRMPRVIAMIRIGTGITPGRDLGIMRRCTTTKNVRCSVILNFED